MQGPRVIRRALALLTVVLVSGAQLAAWACPMGHETRSAASASSAPDHAQHHGASSEIPPAQDDAGDESGTSDCAMMLSCATPAVVLATPALERFAEHRHAAPSSADSRYAAPSLSHLTPPPRTA